MLILLTINISCNNKFLKKDFIDISYLPGNIETSITISPQIFINVWNDANILIDTITIDHESFEEIKAFILGTHDIVEKTYECDARMFVKFDSLKYYIGEVNCISDSEGNMIRNNLKFVYLVKSKTGYYNCISIEDLIIKPEIQMYGIPKDYEYKTLNINKPKEQFVKIVLQDSYE